MAQNTFGSLLSLTTFGTSHGPAIGGVLDGFPSGFQIDISFIERQLQRRATHRQFFSSPRKEADKVEFLSGLFEGKTTGDPIAFIILNQDARPEDYSAMKEVYRPGHADLTYALKYGHRDHRGGGRASARETATWVVAGSLAQQWLEQRDIHILAWVASIGSIMIPPHIIPDSLQAVMDSPLAMPHPESESKAREMLERLAAEGDTIGGTIKAIIKGVPAGLGEPVFEKFQAVLAKAMMSINAVKAFEVGEGFTAGRMKGSEHNDLMHSVSGEELPEFRSDHAGGLLGGISNGQDIRFRLGFKPVSSIRKPQEMFTVRGAKALHIITGRHDVCVVPRAVPIVEALSALVTADLLLRNNAYQEFQD